MIKRFTVTLFLFSASCLLFSQSSVRVQLMSGGNVSLVFNSIAKYKAGITLNNYTTVGITVDEQVPDNYTAWEVDINAQGASFQGTNPANTVPLNLVVISTSIVNGCAGCVQNHSAGLEWPLTNVPEKILEGPGGADDILGNLYNFKTDQFAITYYIGVPAMPPGNTMLGRPADFYSDAIILTITMTGP